MPLQQDTVEPVVRHLCGRRKELCASCAYSHQPLLSTTKPDQHDACRTDSCLRSGGLLLLCKVERVEAILSGKALSWAFRGPECPITKGSYWQASLSSRRCSRLGSRRYSSSSRRWCRSHCTAWSVMGTVKHKGREMARDCAHCRSAGSVSIVTGWLGIGRSRVLEVSRASMGGCMQCRTGKT